jgi:hypothetical protein
MAFKISANLGEKKPHFLMDFAIPGKAHVEVVIDDRSIDRDRASRILRAIADRLLECNWPPDQARSSSTTSKAGAYRVCFLNEFPRGSKNIMTCQRSIVIRLAKTRERAVEAAKKRFARLEGVPDWHFHAAMIDVETIEAEPSTPMRLEEPHS